jgi:hypothetical protein
VSVCFRSQRLPVAPVTKRILIPPAPLFEIPRFNLAYLPQRRGAVKKLKIGCCRQEACAGAPAPPRWNARSARVFGRGFRALMRRDSPDSIFSQLQDGGRALQTGVASYCCRASNASISHWSLRNSRLRRGEAQSRPNRKKKTERQQLQPESQVLLSSQISTYGA